MGRGGNFLRVNYQSLHLYLILFFLCVGVYAYGHRSECQREPNDVCADCNYYFSCRENQYCKRNSKPNCQNHDGVLENRDIEGDVESTSTLESCDIGCLSRDIASSLVKVIKVSDGDTVTVLTENKQQVRVRLYGIDTPEKRQPFGNKAKQFTSALVFGERVFIQVIDRDRYDRSVALVQLSDGRLLNEELLKSGLAWVYERYCKKAFCKKWKTIEIQAKANKRGLFRNENALEPWKARRRPTSY